MRWADFLSNSEYGPKSQEQLQKMILQLEEMLKLGFTLPEGVDLEEMKKIAYETYD